MLPRKFINIELGRLIMEIGWGDLDMELGSKYGLMDQNIWENGLKEKRMEKVNFSTQTEITTKVTGATTKPVDTASTSMKMETSTKENGKMTFSTATAKNDGQMAPVTRVLITKERSMALAFTNGPMAPSTMAIGTIMSLKESVYIPGLTAESIEVSGRTQTCMVSGHTSGLMAESLLESMIMIKSTGMASTHGLMTGSTEAGGKRGNKTDLEFTLFMKRLMNKKCKERAHLRKKDTLPPELHSRDIENREQQR